MSYERGGIITASIMLTLAFAGVYLAITYDSLAAAFVPLPMVLGAILIINEARTYMHINTQAHHAKHMPAIRQRVMSDNTAFRDWALSSHTNAELRTKRGAMAKYSIGWQTWRRWQDDLVDRGLALIDTDGSLVYTCSLNELLTSLNK